MSEDLDPIYVMLKRADLPRPILYKWLLAYWCLYNATSAARVVEAADREEPRQYYTVLCGAVIENWPHGFERRHFRGKKAIDAVSELSRFGSPKFIVESFMAPTLAQVATNVMSHQQFGPWIAWKIADMIERILGMPVSFDDACLAMYRDPVMGAALLKFGDKHAPINAGEVNEVVEQVLTELSPFKAPPSYDRPLNIQEVETLLCKYKAHVGGHYPLGNDSHEIKKGLMEYRNIPLCNQLLQCLEGVGIS